MLPEWTLDVSHVSIPIPTGLREFIVYSLHNIIVTMVMSDIFPRIDKLLDTGINLYSLRINYAGRLNENVAPFPSLLFSAHILPP
jgi:hypothetical protein